MMQTSSFTGHTISVTLKTMAQKATCNVFVENKKIPINSEIFAGPYD